MNKELTTWCKDWGDAPGCLGTADSEFTMDFSDIGEGKIFWCSACGPRAKRLDELITEAYRKDPQRVLAALEVVEKKCKEEGH